MGLSGWITQAIIICIGISLIGIFGETPRNLTVAYGIILILLAVWYIGRRMGVIPAV